MFAAEFGSNYCCFLYFLYDWDTSWCSFTSLFISGSGSQNFVSSTSWWTDTKAKFSILVCSFGSAKSGLLAASCVNSVGASNLIILAISWANGMSWTILSIGISCSLHTDGWVLASVGIFHWWAQDFSLEIITEDWAAMGSGEGIKWAEFSILIGSTINTNFFCWATITRIYL